MPDLVDHWSDYVFSSEFSDDSDSPMSSPHILTSVKQSTGENPSKVEFQGSENFLLNIDSPSSSQKWLFSPFLKKLYARIGEVLPINFKINPGTSTSNMFIRAVMVYDSVDNWMHPVERCPLHSRPQHKTNNDYPHVNHVLFCDNRHAQYNCDEESKRYSVLVPFGEPQPGATYLTFVYGFKCKSSCEGGMNRRHTSVIFTLEQDGEVKGRQVLEVRICGSPMRDYKTDHSNLPDYASFIPRGKKRKIVECKPVKEEVNVYIPQEPPQPPEREEGSPFPFCLEIRGEQLYKFILKRASDRYNASVLPNINLYKKLRLQADKL